MHPDRTWHILDVGSIWMREFASALTDLVPGVMAWQPEMSAWGAIQHGHRFEEQSSPPLRVCRFPLQRGYARQPIATLLPYHPHLLRRLLARTPHPETSILICTTPFYAPLAEHWPGQVIYYATDLTAEYEGLNHAQVKQLDRRMCQVATAVCPNSHRIAAYFVEQAGCDPNKITVVPNATRSGNIAAQPLLTPGHLPPPIANLPRPIAGIIGNLAGNMDWQFLAEAIRLTPGITWVFVGPTSMPIAEPAEQQARAWALQHAHFAGPKPYGELQGYARAFDVAVLPYRKKEPTYSGSSTRFYEHLAACRPIVATRGFAELLGKEPLLTLVDSAEQLASKFRCLRHQNFRDGLETDRWNASKTETWTERARTLAATIAE